MSNFWKVDSKLAIAQRSVSVPSENGLAYTEHGKIVIKIDPSVEYFLPSESYVQFRLKLKLDGTAKLDDKRQPEAGRLLRQLVRPATNLEDEPLLAHVGEDLLAEVLEAHAVSQLEVAFLPS